jgi:hypothetical protein
LVLHEAFLPKRATQEFALRCAEHVLPIFEAAHPEDKRVRMCIEMTRLYQRGETSKEELERARHAAACAAYTYAANAAAATAIAAIAAAAAAYAAEAAYAAAYAAAAYAAAYAAAAYAAAYVNERAWQVTELAQIVKEAAQ